MAREWTLGGTTMDPNIRRVRTHPLRTCTIWNARWSDLIQNPNKSMLDNASNECAKQLSGNRSQPHANVHTKPIN